MIRILGTTAIAALLGSAAFAAPKLPTPGVTDTLTPLPIAAHEGCDEDERDEDGNCPDGDEEDGEMEDSDADDSEMDEADDDDSDEGDDDSDESDEDDG